MRYVSKNERDLERDWQKASALVSRHLEDNRHVDADFLFRKTGLAFLATISSSQRRRVPAESISLDTAGSL